MARGEGTLPGEMQNPAASRRRGTCDQHVVDRLPPADPCVDSGCWMWLVRSHGPNVSSDRDRSTRDWLTLSVSVSRATTGCSRNLKNNRTINRFDQKSRNIQVI